MSDGTTVRLQHCLDRLKAGDQAARRELVETAYRRLVHLARKMFGDFARLRRWEQSEDVLQSALARLWRALEHVTPPTPLDFFRLAALQVRRELISLTRHHFGPEGPATHYHRDGEITPPPSKDWDDSSFDPKKLDAWSAFHEQVGLLPDDQRDVFELLWYQGLSQEEAAEALDESVRTIQRRWRQAKKALHDALGSSPLNP